MASCIGIIILSVVMWLVGPIINFFCGYIAGSVLSWAVGDTLINGLNVLFNTTRFGAHMLPMICGTLAVIGSFFKSSLSTSKKD